MRCSSLSVLAFALAVGTAMSASASEQPRDRPPDPKPKRKRPKTNPSTRTPPPDLAMADQREDERELDELIRRAVEEQDRSPAPAPFVGPPNPFRERDALASNAADEGPAPPFVGPPRPPVNQRPGVDLATARRMAPSLAQHLTRAGRANYDRRLVRTFQTRAGLIADGIYGGATRGALLYFQANNAPQPFFKPANTIPYNGPLPL